MRYPSTIILLFLLIFFRYISVFPQTLDQILRSFSDATPSLSNTVTSKKVTNINPKTLYSIAPGGIRSFFSTPNTIEEIQMGYLTVFIPKGYGKNIEHFGIWNAIPFVIFDNNSLELRFGFIFENRQAGFIPDEWISTSITGENLPNIEFLVSRLKTFLNFSHGSSQWRTTVFLTEEQIKQLEQYANSDQSLFTVKHTFIDSSTRPYLVGSKHKSFFTMILSIYNQISALPFVKKFNASEAFPDSSFFEEIVMQYNTTNITNNTTNIIDNTNQQEVETNISDEYTDTGYYYYDNAGYYEETTSE